MDCGRNLTPWVKVTPHDCLTYIWRDYQHQWCMLNHLIYYRISTIIFNSAHILTHISSQFLNMLRIILALASRPCFFLWGGSGACLWPCLSLCFPRGWFLLGYSLLRGPGLGSSLQDCLKDKPYCSMACGMIPSSMPNIQAQLGGSA